MDERKAGKKCMRNFQIYVLTIEILLLKYSKFKY